MSRVARHEWCWVISVSLLTLAVSTLPMLAGYLAQTPEQRFVGALYDVQDYHSHLARMRLGAQGELRYRSLFTPEPHPSEPVILYDFLLGFAASRVGISVSVAYELSRLAGGLALLLAAYCFIAEHIPEASTRRLAFTLAIVSSGLGWLVLTHPAFSYPHQSPMDFWLADAYLFFSIMGFPHFGWAIAALLMGFVAWLRYREQPNAQWLAALAACSLALGFLQVFELALLGAVIAADAVIWLVRRQPGARSEVVRAAGVAALVLVPLCAALAWPYARGLQTNPMFQVWNAQSGTVSPSPVHYLIGYGLLWPLVGLGMWWAWRRPGANFGFPIVWIATVAVLIYLPNNIQYRWLEGVHVPLAMLGAIGLERVLAPAVASRLSRTARSARYEWWVITLAVLATMPSTLYLVAGNALLGATHWPKAFLSQGEMTSIEWLGQNSEPDDVVLASLEVGNAIPGRIGRRVFYGHWAETMYVDQKRALVAAFFSDMPEADRRALLHDYGVRYVFWGPRERALGTFDPSHAPYLIQTFRAGDVTIYRVESP
jgi:hypothetical protein